MADSVFAYTVEKGDTMSKIAREHNVSLEELAEANPQIKDLDLIYVGQVIHTEIDTSKMDENKVSTRDTRLEKNAPSEQKSKEESTKIESTNKISLSDYEIDLLARIVRAEAQGEPFEGKVAVATVVLNRLESPKFPNTIKGVIYQRGQFQPVANGKINRPADKESIRAVYAALSDMRHITQNSLFFYNPTIATSRWLDSRQTTVVIGNHVFKN
nr:cell wall hydrolase [Bacillus pinisoli]